MCPWYYNDLKSNKRGDCLGYSVDVPGKMLVFNSAILWL